MLILEPHEHRRKIDAAVFDFDGTLSTLRAGWESVMEPLMVEAILGDRAEVTALVRAYIDESTGIQTVLQMRWLAETVAARGGHALDEWDYKAEYNRRLLSEVMRRRDAVLSGKTPREAYLVPGGEALLAALHERGVKLYAASGTDDADVRAEAAVLGLDRYFTRISGAGERSTACSKEAVLRELLDSDQSLLVVGDGKVEIALGRASGALTLGAATDEKNGCERIAEDKLRRLKNAGAHAIVPNFSETEEILAWI